MLSNREHFRKIVAGVAMVTAPIVGLAAFIIAPQFESDSVDQLRRYAGGIDRTVTGLGLALLGTVLALFAVLGLIHLLREREVAWGHVGGGMALVGLMGIMTIVGAELAVAEIAEDAGATETAGALVDNIYENGAYLAAVTAGIVLASLGFLVLGIGLYRARAVPEPAAVGVALFGLVQFAGFAASSTPVTVAAFAILTLALVPVGMRILVEADEEWEHAPRFHGYHAEPTGHAGMMT